MRAFRPLGIFFAVVCLAGLGAPAGVVAQGIPPGREAAPAAGPLTDDGDVESLRLAVECTHAYLKGLRVAQFRVAGRSLSVARLRLTCERFLALLDQKLEPAAFEAAVKAEFELLEAPGHDGAGSMHLTGYHLPQLDARRKPEGAFRFPLYAPPPMVNVNLGRFKPGLAGQSVKGIVRGSELVPMPTRQEIDDGKVLAGQGLELAYVADELGRNAVMVQGSGLLRFEDGHIENLNYAGQNGYPYISLGTALVRDGVMQSVGLTYPKIESYFAAHPEKLHGYLNRNASYVFFKLAREGPYGCTGVAVVPGRSIATDQGQYPGGLIGHLSYPRAAFGPGGMPLNWGQGGRFVAGHDTGGAIRGPGRIDVYWGGGQEAAWRAGTMNGPGRWRILLLREGPPPAATPAPEASPSPATAPAGQEGSAPVLDNLAQRVAAPAPTSGSQESPQAPPQWLPSQLPLATAPPAARALPTLAAPGGFLPPAAGRPLALRPSPQPVAQPWPAQNSPRPLALPSAWARPQAPAPASQRPSARPSSPVQPQANRPLLPAAFRSTLPVARRSIQPLAARQALPVASRSSAPIAHTALSQSAPVSPVRSGRPSAASPHLVASASPSRATRSPWPRAGARPQGAASAAVAPLRPGSGRPSSPRPR